MNFPGMLIGLTLLSFVGCASTSSGPENRSTENERTTESKPPLEAELAAPVIKAADTYLICKASKKSFYYDWSASSLAGGQAIIDQNNIRYDFRSAKKPAGDRGENLKVGECGWAKQALAISKKATKSQVNFKSLSDEATQMFYKMKTGKVFKVPVRQTKSGLEAAPGGVSILR